MNHIELLQDLLHQCSDIGLRLYEHHYNYLAFGSWSLVIGTAKHRMRFVWDGKESYLSIAFSSFNNQNSLPVWEPVFPSIGGTTITQEKVFEHIIQVLREYRAT